MAEDHQKTWDEYYERIKKRRLVEADILWSKMHCSGVSEETVLALDFVHFARNRQDADDLAAQLSEDYNIEIVPAEADNYWLINGTTRPYGITLRKEQHTEWVQFMYDVARSYACVFSTWSLEAPTLNKSFSSEHNDSGLD